MLPEEMRLLATSMLEPSTTVWLGFLFSPGEGLIICRDRHLTRKSFVLWNDPWLDIYTTVPPPPENSLESLVYRALDNPRALPSELVYKAEIRSAPNGWWRVDQCKASRNGARASHADERDRETVWRIIQGLILGEDALGVETRLDEDEWVATHSWSHEHAAPAANWSGAIALIQRMPSGYLQHMPTGLRIPKPMAITMSAPPLRLQRPTCPLGHGLMNARIGPSSNSFQCRETTCQYHRNAWECIA